MNINAETFWLLLAFPVYVIFCMVCLKKKLAIKNILFYSILYLYIVGVITVTFFPLAFEPSIYGRNIVQLIPFSTIYDLQSLLEKGLYGVVLKQIGGNFIMLLPAGFFLQMLTKKYGSYASAILVGFSISLAIESLQLFLSLTIMLGRYKIFDVDDLFLNTLGFMIGYFIFNQCMKIKYLRDIIKKSEL